MILPPLDDTADPVQDLVRALVRLPSVGEKSARRIVQHLLTAEPAFAEALGARIAALPSRVRRCEGCGTFTARVRCGPCSDPGRLGAMLCVVARPSDADAIERTRTFRGRYHVLHTLLDPLAGVGPAEFPLGALLGRVRAEAVQEVIVATPPTVVGEATALYLAESLRAAGVRVSRIASGVPHGGELEYTDPITLGRALEGRRTL